LTNNRQKDDWYPTLPSATAALLSREKMAFAWFVWDSAFIGDDPQLFWISEK